MLFQVTLKEKIPSKKNDINFGRGKFYHSSDYKDVEDTAENNFQEALTKLKSHLDVTECETRFEESESSDDCDDCEDCEC